MAYILSRARGMGSPTTPVLQAGMRHGLLTLNEIWAKGLLKTKSGKILDLF